MKENRFNIGILYVAGLALGLMFGSCTDSAYEEDTSLYKKEIASNPNPPKVETHATEGGDEEVKDKPGEE